MKYYLINVETLNYRASAALARNSKTKGRIKRTLDKFRFQKKRIKNRETFNLV